MNFKPLCVVGILLAFTGSTAGQMPIPHGPGGCNVSVLQDASEEALEEGDTSGGEFAIPGGDFCSQYTLAGAGWEDTLELYLGSGADHYLPLLKYAVRVWNRALERPGRDPIIRINQDSRPTSYQIPERFWENANANSDPRVYDGESVIYFGASSKRSSRGYAKIRSLGNQIEESDIYINTAHEEKYGDDLAFTQKISGLDEYYGIYAFINATYAVVLHEIGHAIGLAHIPVAGNAMTADFAVGTLDQWAAPLELFMILQMSIKQRHYSSIHPSQLRFVDRHSRVFPYMVVYGRRRARSPRSLHRDGEAGRAGENGPDVHLRVLRFAALHRGALPNDEIRARVGT